MKTDRSAIGLIAFIATLVAVVLLSKIGGSGADLAIMTGLIGVLGMLAPGLVPSRGNEKERPNKVEVVNQPDQPVPTTESHDAHQEKQP